MLAIQCSSHCHWLFPSRLLTLTPPETPEAQCLLLLLLLLLGTVRQAPGKPKSLVVTISVAILILDPGSYVLGGECLMVFRLTIPNQVDSQCSFVT